MNKQFNIQNPFVFSIISGKGGVGKTLTSVNTAATINKMGYKVALIDADLGFSNCATFFNETVFDTVTDWIMGDCNLEDLMLNCNGITVITASDNPGKRNFAPEVMMQALDQIIVQLKLTHDFIVIDTPAGAGEMVLWSLDASQLGVLILVDEPSAISDVYRLCKYIYKIDPSYRFASVVNFSDSEEAAINTVKQFNNILTYFLDKQTEYFGFIPDSFEIAEAIKKQQTLQDTSVDRLILTELKFIAQNIIADAINVEAKSLKKVH